MNISTKMIGCYKIDDDGLNLFYGFYLKVDIVKMVLGKLFSCGEKNWGNYKSWISTTALTSQLYKYNPIRCGVLWGDRGHWAMSGEQ